eukprot:scaffold108235_cov35-Tisochrysis_lutea.AAC.2
MQAFSPADPPASVADPYAEATHGNEESAYGEQEAGQNYLGPLSRPKNAVRSSPYGDTSRRDHRGRGGATESFGRGSSASGRGRGQGGKGGKGGAARGGGKGGGGKGSGRVPPHLLRYQAFASVGQTGFMGGGAMGYHEGKPKPNSAGPR